MGTFIFDKRKTSPLGSERKRRGGGDIFQFTELGGARCVEDSERHKPELRCYIYPTTHPLPSPTPAGSRNLSMYVAFLKHPLARTLSQSLERPVRPFPKVWTRFEKPRDDC